jgi:CMP-N,N'-diacetyllegionaminic acid synthase
MEILALIPARGGSTGIKQKNILNLGGKPLIQYSIDSAKNSKKITRIVVSTDDPKIKKISQSLSAEVPFLRPKKFAKKNSLMIDVIKHTLNSLKSKFSYCPDIVSLLQPTTPFRNTSIIDLSINQLIKSNATSVISVSPIRQHPLISFRYIDNFLTSFSPYSEKNSNRQNREKLFYPTGAVYTFWTSTLQKYDSIYGPKIKPIITNEPELSIDIDEKFDFFMAEMVSKYWKNYNIPK